MVGLGESTLLNQPDLRIRLEDVHIAFGSNQVLRGVHLGVQRGETLVVVGRSGEGKSVLLKHIVALLRPDRGAVWIDDYQVDTLERSLLTMIRKKVAMIFQGSALFDSMTVEENVAFPYREEKRLSRKEIRERVVENLKRVHLTDPGVLEKKPAELSGGMKKRVGVARALSQEPEIVLWDEPTTGLDPVTADAVNDLIQETQDHTGATSVVVTHDMPSAFKVGDRMALLHKGRIAYEGSIEETRETENPLMRQFIDGTATGPLTEEETLG